MTETATKSYPNVAQGSLCCTFGVVNWIDVFSRECSKEIVIDSLKYCIEQKGLILHAWVIMTNHVHLIPSAKEGFELAAIIRDFKKNTSMMIIAQIEGNAQESRKNWMICLPDGRQGCLSVLGQRTPIIRSTSFGSRIIIR